MELLYKTEKHLFTFNLIISLIVWLLLILGTLGTALLWILFFFIFHFLSFYSVRIDRLPERYGRETHTRSVSRSIQSIE